MKNALEFKGEWFLPSKEDNKVYGTLSYHPEDGSKLEVIGRLDDGNGDFDKDVILGITTDAKYITLRNYFVSHRSITSKSNRKSIGEITVYTINEIIEGGHLENIGNLRLSKINVEFNNLIEWIDINGFIRTDLKSGKWELGEMEIVYKKPNNIEFDITDTIKGEFNFLFSRSVRTLLDTEQSISQDVELVFSSYDVNFSLEEAMKSVFVFQDFLVLGLYRSTYVSSIKFQLLEANLHDASNELILYIKVPKNDAPKRTYFNIF